MEKDKIEVGEYFRSKNIGIMKFIYGCTYKTENNEEQYIYNLEYGNGKFMPLSAKGLEEMSHSKSIIDLIEVGDYVNKSKVIDIAQGKNKAVFIESQEQKLALIPIVEKQIKSIVTKEQFKEMEYKV